MKGYNKLRHKALEILETKLSKELYYHGINHTLDVVNVLDHYIKNEDLDSNQVKLLRIGVFYHDIGFTVSNLNHEENGIIIAEKYMREYGSTEEEINSIKGLIRATKIPQTPKNLLERIICDADLDYLGRKDFYPISNKLFKELKAFGVIDTLEKWNVAQIAFLESHNYHTEFGRKVRSPEKEKRIEELKKLATKPNGIK